MDIQMAFAIALIAVGAGLAIVGVLLRSIWRVLVRPFYRQPDAQEPSAMGWRARQGAMIVLGVGTVIGAVLLATSLAEPAPSTGETQEEQLAERCQEVVDAVDQPGSEAAADAAIAAAAAGLGYDVEREETDSEESVPLPSGETVIVVELTQWTVVDGRTDVASFTWTSSGGAGNDRFTAAPCTGSTEP